MRITYNAPFVLTFTFLAICVKLIDDATFGNVTAAYFTLRPIFDPTDWLTYFRLFSHVLGHDNWNHLTNNFTFILLIGPILEEKYGTQNLLFLTFFTSFATGVLNILFFPSYLMGASGVAFMMILLGSFANVRVGTIPLTFIVIVMLLISQELLTMFKEDNNISEFAHIVGGVCGSIFGFIFNYSED